MRAAGKDDPALAKTTWPMPDAGESDHDSIEWTLRYGNPTRSQMLEAAEIVAAYGALVACGTAARQTRRLVALRRVWRRRNRGVIEEKWRAEAGNSGYYGEPIMSTTDPVPSTKSDSQTTDIDSGLKPSERMLWSAIAVQWWLHQMLRVGERQPYNAREFAVQCALTAATFVDAMRNAAEGEALAGGDDLDEDARRMLFDMFGIPTATAR